MNKKAVGIWGPALFASALPLAALAEVFMDGEVTLDYYVSEVTADGYEEAEMEFYVESVTNEGGARSGPLSLGAWLTRDPSPTGTGTEAAYLPIGTLPGDSTLEVWDFAAADDVPPGEYYMHTLLQDDRFSGSFEDSRSLSPRLLWRGGLEAEGPLTIYSYDFGHHLEISAVRLRNHRIDERFTNDIELTLYATYGFGPAADGIDLCRAVVPGIYAGDISYNASFDCFPDAIPDGEYTLHLSVAEIGGRGGVSTLSGPDAYFSGGELDYLIDDDCCDDDYHEEYYVGAFGAWLLLPLGLIGFLRRLR